MIKAHHLKHLKGRHGKFPTVPVVAAAAGGLLLLMLSKSSHAATKPPEPPVPPPPTPPNPPNVRPKRTPTPPPGTKYWATTTPVCGPNDPAKCRNGLLVHTDASSASPLVGPEDVSATSPHLVTGDEAAVLRDDIVDPTGNGRIWAEIVTPTNVHGFVSFHGPSDPAGSSNFTNVVPFQPSTSGYASYGYSGTHGHYYPLPGVGAASPRTGWAPQRSWLRCVAPSGCALGTTDGRPSGVIVESGGMVQFIGVSGDAMHVRYYDKVHNRTFTGWVDARWLQ